MSKGTGMQTLRLARPVRWALARYAEEQGITVSDAIRRAVLEMLDREGVMIRAIEQQLPGQLKLENDEPPK